MVMLFHSRTWRACKAFVLIAILLVGGACAVRPPAPLSPQDPSDPEGRQTPLPMQDQPLVASELDRLPGGAAPAPPQAAPGHESHSPPQSQAPPEAVYSCPMHPQVKSAEPGTCPICHMKLVRPEPPDDSGGLE